jgi:predicted phosphodiesterase
MAHRKLLDRIAWLRTVSYGGRSSNFQFMSDLHLEVGQQYTTFEFPARCPCLILAGDIGRLCDYDGYLKFLQAQIAKFRRVFLVLGNHEFYGLDHQAGIEKARQLTGEPSLQGRVTLLHRTRYDDDVLCPGVSILGCTLWSAVPETAKEAVTARVKDFQKISGWTTETHNGAHREDLSWLRQELEKLAGQPGQARRKVLVVTHHAPCIDGTSSPKDTGNTWTSAFATDILPVRRDGLWDPVAAWIFGHTHFTVDFDRGGTRVVSNQRGYVLPGSPAPREKVRARAFDPDRVLHL